MSGVCKLVLFVVVAATVPLQVSQAETAPARGGPTESVASAPDTEPNCSCPTGPCEEEPHSGWLCGQQFCDLMGRLKADCGPVPWANWSEHPLSVGCFAGLIVGGPLIEEWVGTTHGFDGGWQLGWDVSPNWGTQMRFAFTSMALYDGPSAMQARQALDNALGLAANDPKRALEDHRNSQLFQWDVDVLYYPWGETRFRPYFFTGMGLTNVYFRDRLDKINQTTCLSLPMGLGAKYLCSQQLAVRLDLMDDVALSSDLLRTQHNLSLTAGVELRFGGSRKVYWPWDPGRSFW